MLRESRTEQIPSLGSNAFLADDLPGEGNYVSSRMTLQFQRVLEWNSLVTPGSVSHSRTIMRCDI